MYAGSEKEQANIITEHFKNMSALNISTGPLVSDRRASTGQYIVSFTGPAGPPS